MVGQLTPLLGTPKLELILALELLLIGPRKYHWLQSTVRKLNGMFLTWEMGS